MNLLKLFRDKSFTDKLPDTISEPLITAPLDAVTDEK